MVALRRRTDAVQHDADGGHGEAQGFGYVRRPNRLKLLPKPLNGPRVDGLRPPVPLRLRPTLAPEVHARGAFVHVQHRGKGGGGDVRITRQRVARRGFVGEAAGVRFELNLRKHGITAQAVLREGEFVVQAGSTARREWAGVGTESSGYAMLHGELARTGVLAPQGEACVFTSDYAFGSASAAAAVVCGRPSNGTLEWKVKGEGTTYKEWEARQLGAEPESAATVPMVMS